MVEDKLEIIKKACEDKLGENLEVIKLQNHIIADYFVIVTGSNFNHTKAIVDEIDQELAKNGYDSNVEGLKGNKWLLVDAGDIIVHVFTEDAREYYNLEKLWEETE